MKRKPTEQDINLDILNTAWREVDIAINLLEFSKWLEGGMETFCKTASII